MRSNLSKVVAVAVALALALPFGGFALAAAPVTTVSGVLYHADLSTPAEGYKVVAYLGETEQAVGQSMTDKDGKFAFPGLAPGKYSVVVSDSKGVAQARATIDVLATGNPLLKLALPSKKAAAALLGGAAGGAGVFTAANIGGFVLMSAIVVSAASEARDGVVYVPPTSPFRPD